MFIQVSMLVTIQPSSLSGIVNAPASKSSMQRACAAALLTNGSTTIINPGRSNDDKAALGVLSALGASWELNKDELRVISSGITGRVFSENGEDLEINCGESG